MCRIFLNYNNMRYIVTVFYFYILNEERIPSTFTIKLVKDKNNL